MFKFNFQSEDFVTQPEFSEANEQVKTFLKSFLYAMNNKITSFMQFVGKFWKVINCT